MDIDFNKMKRVYEEFSLGHIIKPIIMFVALVIIFTFAISVFRDGRKAQVAKDARDKAFQAEYDAAWRKLLSGGVNTGKPLHLTSGLWYFSASSNVTAAQNFLSFMETNRSVALEVAFSTDLGVYELMDPLSAKLIQKEKLTNGYIAFFREPAEKKMAHAGH